MTREGVGAVVVYGSSLLYAHRATIAELAIKSRLPAMCPGPEWVTAGFVMTYSASFHDMFRLAPYFVDRLLKGAKPTDLPVMRATRFEFVINAKGARDIGLEISPALLARADEVIE